MDIVGYTDLCSWQNQEIINKKAELFSGGNMKILDLLTLSLFLFAGVACSSIEKSPDRDVASTTRVTAKGLVCTDNIIDMPKKTIKLSYDKGEWIEGRQVRYATYKENLANGFSLKIDSTMDDLGRGDVGRGTIKIEISGHDETFLSEAHFNVSARDLTSNMDNEVISVNADIQKESFPLNCRLVK